MRLTVAVCTYNPDEALLQRALDAILEETVEHASSEIILVDNNSEPPLEGRGFLDRYPLKILREPVPGLSAAREAVIANATGDVIVFVDDDNILAPGYLATVVQRFSSDASLGLLGGRIVPEYPVTPPAWFSEFEEWLAIRRYEPDIEVETTGPPYSNYFPIGAGIAVRRTLAAAYVTDCAGTTTIQGRRGQSLSSGEDVDLGFFVLSRGFKLAVSGKLCLTHVISERRLTPDYLERLAVGNVASSLALDAKWSPRFGRSVLPSVIRPLPSTIARYALTTLMRPASPRFRIKSRRYGALVRSQLAKAGRPRSHPMSKTDPALGDDEVLERYHTNYGLPPGTVSIEQIRFHLALETQLTTVLLSSAPEERWDVFERSYNELYEKLPWLAEAGTPPDLVRWQRLIGPSPKRVYEVGSGAGALAGELARCGYDVTATDVSRERGGERAERPGLTWATTDGVHLAQHASPQSFDVVISDQVIEHLHPDDVTAHFAGAFQLLRPGGRYVFRTPHRLTGPHDVSLVFGYGRAIGMHLREYTCTELERVADRAGFTHVRSVLTLAGVPQLTRPSRMHLRYEKWLERSRLMHRTRTRRALSTVKAPVKPEVWLVAERPRD